MRDIKFRAWDNGMEMMVYQGDDEIYICFDGEKWKLLDYYRTHWETDEYGMSEIEQPWEVENIELMQYTGLKDSNGVDIYEGDIIRGMDVLSARTGGRVDDREVVGQVVIDSSSVWGFSIVVYETEYHLNDFLENDQEAKVIGNIYENPELLED
ncbi:YopX family protein [Aerococcus sp. NPDC058936]|uniref:YopX family protein n=1 Tax=Aerococcus sp. NPDC058936 TaxID=3346674 RepID=UPI00366A9A15